MDLHWDISSLQAFCGFFAFLSSCYFPLPPKPFFSCLLLKLSSHWFLKYFFFPSAILKLIELPMLLYSDLATNNFYGTSCSCLSNKVKIHPPPQLRKKSFTLLPDPSLGITCYYAVGYNSWPALQLLTTYREIQTITCSLLLAQLYTYDTHNNLSILHLPSSLQCFPLFGDFHD